MKKDNKRLNYDTMTKHPLCLGMVYYTLDGNEYDCGYYSTVECDQCRFLAYNRGRGKDPRAKCNNPE